MIRRFMYHSSSVIFVNENENGQKQKNNEFINENYKKAGYCQQNMRQQ